MFNLSNATGGGNGAGGVFTNPNGRINAGGRVELDISELKVLGTYRVPVWGGFNASGVYRLNSGTVSVHVEMGTLTYLCQSCMF